MANSCSCIIPFYNEAERISKVLTVISKVKNLTEIICVNDGSSDGGQQLVARNFPKVKLINLSKNRGKTSAIKAGLKHAVGKYIFLCDADLKNLRASNVDNAIKKMRQAKKGMVILAREKFNPNLPNQFYSAQTSPIFMQVSKILGGERVLAKSDLEEIIKTGVKNYQLEVAINQYFIDQNIPCYWISSSALNNYKVKQLGKVGVVKKYINMVWQILSYLGPIHLCQQYKQFCKIKVN